MVGGVSRAFFTKLNCFWLCGKSDTKWHWESNLQHHSEQPQQAPPGRTHKHVPASLHTQRQSYYKYTLVRAHTITVHTITANHTGLAHSHSFFLFLPPVFLCHTLSHPPTPDSSTATSDSPSPVHTSNYNIAPALQFQLELYF